MTARSRPGDQTVFRPVKTANAFEETVERLLQTVRLGAVAPGERFPPERELASRLGISRVTLREAIRALQQAGYLESRRGRYGGTFVTATPPTASSGFLQQISDQIGETVEDILILRQVLEVGAAEVAASRSLPEQAHENLRQRLAATESADSQSYRRADSQLHLAICEAAGSPSLTSAVVDVRIRLNELLDAIPLLPRNIRHSNEQHAMIVDAVLTRDAERARALMAQHILATSSLLRGFLA